MKNTGSFRKLVLPVEAKAAIAVLATLLAAVLLFLSMNSWGLAERKYIITSDDIWVVETDIKAGSDNAVKFFLNMEEKKKKKKDSDDGILYVLTHKLQAMDIKDGNLLFEAAGPAASLNVTFSGFGIVCGSDPLKIYSLEDGREVSSISLKSRAKAVAKGFLPNSIYIFDGLDLMLFDLTGEKTIWSKKVFDSIPDGFAGIAHSHAITAVGSHESLHFFDSGSGLPLGVLKMEKGQKYRHLAGISGENCAVHTSPENGGKGMLCYFTLNEKKGTPPVIKEKFRIPAQGCATSPAVNQIGIFTGSLDEKNRILLEAYSPADGSRMWAVPLEGTIPHDRTVNLTADDALLKVIHPSRGLLIFNPKNGALLLEKNLDSHIAKKGAPVANPCYFGMEDDRTLILFEEKSKFLGYVKILSNQDEVE